MYLEASYWTARASAPLRWLLAEADKFERKL